MRKVPTGTRPASHRRRNASSRGTIRPRSALPINKGRRVRCSNQPLYRRRRCLALLILVLLLVLLVLAVGSLGVGGDGRRATRAGRCPRLRRGIGGGGRTGG